jgi:hypothetical protein
MKFGRIWYPLTTYFTSPKQHQQGQKLVSNRWKKNKYEVKNITTVVQKPHFEFIMNEAFKTTYILKRLF